MDALGIWHRPYRVSIRLRGLADHHTYHIIESRYHNHNCVARARQHTVSSTPEARGRPSCTLVRFLSHVANGRTMRIGEPSKNRESFLSSGSRAGFQTSAAAWRKQMSPKMKEIPRAYPAQSESSSSRASCTRPCCRVDFRP